MNPELRALFDDEAQRHVEMARAAILVSGLHPESFVHALRALHSVKGMAAALGFAEIVDVAHAAEDVVRDAKELAAASGATPTAPLAEALARLEAALARRRMPADADGESTPSAPYVPPARVGAEALDRLVENVQSLAVWFERIEHSMGPPADGAVLLARAEARRALTGLAREIDATRLSRVAELVQPLRAAVEAWAAARGVRVNFEIEGSRVRADRSLFERLFDPISQLLRNAVVHGGEPPETRGARGLREASHVVLSFARDPAHLRVEVTDDGPGLDPAAVRRRAVACGAIDAASCERLDDAASLLLLTHPMLAGTTTADTMRGRGVGLAAARTAAESLGGTLTLRSARGVGFRATIVVPLRLALSDGFLVTSGSQRYVLLADAIVAVRPRATDDTSIALNEVLAGEPDPLARTVLVVERDGESRGIAVSHVAERREFAIRRLGPPVEGRGWFVGAVLLGDGGLALAIDPLRVLRDRLAREPAGLRE